MAKFFFAAAVWGRLRLRDVPERGAWDRGRIAYWDETYLDGIARLADMGRKVRAASDLDDAIAASHQAPGIRALWIHEDLLDHAERRWIGAQEPLPAETGRPETARARWRAPAVVSAAVAAAFVVGIMAGGRGPAGFLPSSGPNTEAALETTAPAKLSAYTLVKTVTARVAQSVAGTSTLALSQIAGSRAKAAYAVSVGRFESLAAAERMRHLVLSKGYIVVIVRQGAASQVVTPAYRTRGQAERIGHGLEGSGIPEEIVTLRAP